MLRPFDELAGRTATWQVVGGAFSREFELVSGEWRFATLSWATAFGSLATAATAHDRWTFKRVGFLGPRVTVRVAGGSEDLAVYRPDWGGNGVLAFGDGPSFQLRGAGFWSPRWVFTAGSGEELLAFRPEGLARRHAQLEFGTTAIARPELPLLATLGWYLVLMIEAEMSAAGAVVAIG